MIRFIHCAGALFDAPLGLDDSAKAFQRRQDQKNAFLKIVEDAGEKKADLVLITGDLFDRRYVSKSTVDFLMQTFASCPDCKFIIAPGESDYYSADSIYALVDIPENVYVFNNDALTRLDFEIDGEGVAVYGCARMSKTVYNDCVQEFKAESAGSINIVVVNAPISEQTVSSLVKGGADYCAFADIRQSAEIFDEGDMWYSRAGKVEALSFDGVTQGAYVYVQAEKKSGEFVCKPALISCGCKKYVSVKVNLTGALKNGDVINAVRDRLDGVEGLGENTLLQVVLTGDVAPEVGSTESAILEMAGEKKVFYTEVIDLTVPIYNHEYLSADPTIKGALFNAFRPAICSDDAGVRKSATDALRVGLDALNGADLASAD